MSEGKVAIVTAAGRGMGAACARELAQRGYSLALMSVSGGAVDLAEELGGVGMTGSVTDEADIRELVDKTLVTYGRIDAVVNNTGHPPNGNLLDITDEQWRQGVDIVLLNVVRMARLVTPVMVEQGSGALVNISTFSAFEPSLSFPVSSSLRAALGSFVKLYSDRYGQHGLRMNNLLPGYVENYGIDEKIRASIPMQRQAKLTEIAKTAAFLLSADAGYITGQNIRVDGGLTRSV